MPRWILLFTLLLMGTCALAKNAVVVTEGALVYIDPDFDSTVLTELKEGEPIEVSTRTFQEVFHRVRLKNSMLGFIADNDFQLTEAGKTTHKPAQKQSYKIIKKSVFEWARYRGFGIYNVQYQEETMGLSPTANINYYDFKMVGRNLLIEGDVVTDINIMLKFGAPDYYTKATGVGADGWIFQSDFLFESNSAQSKNLITFLGFGPMFRYSNFTVGLKDSGTGNINYYSLADMVLGLVLNAGVSIRTGDFAIRVDCKYFWEKKQYLGAGVSVLKEF